MHDTRASIRKFLGASALDLGPFGLLGLDPRSCTGDAVEAALQQQLDRLGAHAEGDTPEADEVRLALHAGAAQLLDPRVRDHLCQRWRADAERASGPPIALEPSVESRRESAGREATSQPTRSTVRRGRDEVGPRRRSEDGLAKLIVGAGVVTVALIGLVIAAIVVLSPAPTAPGPPATVPGAGGVAALPPPLGAPLPPGAELTAEELADAAASATPIVGTGATPSTTSTGSRRPRSAFVDPIRTLKQLRDAIPLARTDANAAVAALEPVILQLSEWWASYDPGVRRACDDSVVEALYSLGASPELQEQFHSLLSMPLDLIAQPEEDTPRRRVDIDDIWPVAWSAGMLSRLTRERDLPTRLAAETTRSLDRAMGRGRSGSATFEAGAGLAVRRLSLFLIGDPRERHASAGSAAAFKRWIEACVALGADENSLERLLCDGLEQVLLHAREPDEDLGVFEAIGVIAERVKWRNGGPARARLLDWFRNPGVTDSDLRVLTAALAGRSGAEGVHTTMILSIHPGADDRSRLRARYAAAWSIEGAGRERASEHWLEATRAILDAPPAAPDSARGPIDLLKETAALARLNETARLLWRGEGDAAESLLREAESVQGIGPLIVPVAPPVTVLIFHTTGRGTDAGWAQQYLAAERNIPVRLQLLSDLEQGGRPIGAVDAAVLVEEAVIGSPIQVRHAAARLAGQWADEATIVQSALDELPQAPKTRLTEDMMERITRQTLPPLSDPDWELAVRRALVERLLGLLAAGTPEATVEHYASLIADSYLRASGQEPARGGGATAEGAQRGSLLLWQAVRADAEAVAPVAAAPIPLDQIDRRRTGRMSLASGPVQAFAAEQVSIAEAMAYLVAGERPTAAKGVEAAVARMQGARRAAAHVFEQLRAAEQTILELWLLRFDPEPGGTL